MVAPSGFELDFRLDWSFHVRDAASGKDELPFVTSATWRAAKLASGETGERRAASGETGERRTARMASRQNAASYFYTYFFYMYIFKNSRARFNLENRDQSFVTRINYLLPLRNGKV